MSEITPEQRASLVAKAKELSKLSECMLVDIAEVLSIDAALTAAERSAATAAKIANDALGSTESAWLERDTALDEARALRTKLAAAQALGNRQVIEFARHACPGWSETELNYVIWNETDYPFGRHGVLWRTMWYQLRHSYRAYRRLGLVTRALATPLPERRRGLHGRG